MSLGCAVAFDHLWRRHLYMAVSDHASRAHAAAAEVDVFAQTVHHPSARRALAHLARYLRRAHVVRARWGRRRRLTVRKRERRLDALAVVAYQRLVATKEGS